MKIAAVFLSSALLSAHAFAQCMGCFHPSFGPAIRAYPAEFTNQFVTADFDRDGFLDLVAVAPNGIQFLRGSGSGTFGAPVHFSGSGPSVIATADFNGDGIPDIATGGSEISIYLSNGDGTFQAPIESDSGVEANGIAVADFNGDGIPDLAVNSAVSGPRVYFGNGDGTVQPPLELGFVSAGFIVAGDFNGDGHPDVAAASGLDIYVFLSDGHGGFSAAVVSGVSGTWLAVGDFNRDGIVDLAVVLGDGITIETGNGDGTFTVDGHYPTGTGAFAVAVGDFTLDGIVDLAVTENQGDVAILNGHGDGTFELGSTTHAGVILGALVVGDFDANGRLDVAAVDADILIEVLLADAAGEYPHAVTYATGGSTDTSQPPSVALGDFMGSGHVDVAVANIISQTVGIIPGDGAGNFGTPVSIPVPSPPRWLAAGSFHPGHTDLAVATDAGIQIILSNGDGTFRLLPAFGTLTAYVTTGDFNNDGKTDLAWVGTQFQLQISLGNGDGTFTDGPPIPGSPTADAAAVGLFNADSNADIVVSTREGVTILAGDGAGGLTQSFTYSFTTPSFTKVATADFDGDGNADVVVVHFSGDALLNVEVYWGKGDGTLVTPPDQLEGGFFPADVHGADVNGDGLPDIIIHAYDTFRIDASHQNRTFESSVWMAPVFGGFSETGDVDGDAKTDLVVAGDSPVRMSVLFNTICVPSKLAISVEPSSCDSSGVPFGTQPALRIVDGGDNVMTCDTGSVTASIQTGTGPPGAILGGTTTVPTASGVATFTNLSIDRAGRGYVLDFTHPLGLTRSWTIAQDLSVLLSGPAMICSLGEGTYRTAGGYGRYRWLLDGAPVSRADVVTLSGIAPGSHVLDVSVWEDGCTAADTATLNVIQSPGPPTIIAPVSVRVGQTGIFASATDGANSYDWSLSGGAIMSGQGTSQITFDAGAPGTTMVLRVTAVSGSGCDSPEVSTLIQVDFADAGSGPFRENIDTVARHGITAGCGGGDYCPDAIVTRAQMAVLLLKAEHGANYVPPPAFGYFVDVPPGSFAADWIEQLHQEGITAGCDASHYCPDAPVTRAEMAVFLLKTEHGSDFVPPRCIGVFDDVACTPVPAFAVDWIERLLGEGVTVGCRMAPPLYCPDDSVTRAQMATFLARTFNLQ